MPFIKHLLLGLATTSQAFALLNGFYSDQTASSDVLHTYIGKTFMVHNHTAGTTFPVLIDYASVHESFKAKNTTRVFKRDSHKEDQPLQIENINKWDEKTLESKMTELCNQYQDPNFPKPDCGPWAIIAAIEQSHARRTKQITFKVAGNKHIHYELDLTQVQWVEKRERNVEMIDSAENAAIQLDQNPGKSDTGRRE